MSKPHFLTKPQWELLRNAKARDGRIHTYYVTKRSITALLKHGMIAEDAALRDPKDRTGVEESLKEHLWMAKTYVFTEWHQALRHLRDAQADERSLTQMAYWLTPAALALLEDK